MIDVLPRIYLYYTLKLFGSAVKFIISFPPDAAAKRLVPTCTRMRSISRKWISLLYTTYNYTSGKNHFHEMNGDVGMAGWK